jgi:hypothetical protein
MTNEELEKLLRAWGRVMGERPVVSEEERPARASHALARGMEMAPGKRQVVIRERTSMHRAGQDRRTYMAQAAGGAAVGMRILPAHFVDPVRATETRSYRNESRDWPVPPEVLRVERAALELSEFNDFRGRCLRAYYCIAGSHEERLMRMMAKMSNEELAPFDGCVKLKRFRDEVSYARVWMHGRLA